MTGSSFIIKTHIFEAQHIRHYPGATRNGDADVFRLEAKQYIARSNQQPRDGDVTIIGFHACGFVKELYEPLWEDLLTSLEGHGVGIRSIWIADANNIGASGVLNEKVLGDDPSHSDYARDVLHMTNVFREHMVQPIVGIGHSIGAAIMIELSRMHPRLFASLIMLDPLVGRDALIMGAKMIYVNSVKPDLFPSRSVAAKRLRKPFGKWDARTFKLWMEYGLRDTPTLLYPKPGKVTFRTTKANEVWSYAIPQFDEPNEDGTNTASSRIKYPDAPPEMRPFYQPINDEAYLALPRLRPDVLYLFPDTSALSEDLQADLLARTGTATGGSGGFKEGRVSKAVITNAGHLFPYEKPTECAQEIAKWLQQNLKAWRERVDYEKNHRDNKSTPDRLRLSDEWIKRAKEFSTQKTVPKLKL